MSEVEWQVFHQKEELTTRIANILEEYAPGIGPFKEFLQNADDARAHKFAIILDHNSYKNDKENDSSGLFTGDINEWQGPSLLIYNSAVFSDRDFTNITSLGKSEKFDDNTRIGRYGLGFNVSYHFTDVVSFVSRDQIIFFDPHAKCLPQNLPGLRTNFVKENLISKYPLQLKPFIVEDLKCDMKSHFEGTLMRLPLRNEKQASRSKLSKVSYTIPDTRNILYDLSRAATSLLVFLKNVEEITIYEKNIGEGLTVLSRTGLKNITEKLRRERSLINEYAIKKQQANYSQTEDLRATFSLQVHSEIKASLIPDSNSNSKEPETVDEEWIIHSGSMQGKEDLEKAIQQIQWGGVAVLVSTTRPLVQQEAPASQLPLNNTPLEDNINNTVKEPSVQESTSKKTRKGKGRNEKNEKVTEPVPTPVVEVKTLLNVPTMKLPPALIPHEGGRAYCFLPLPIETGLPCHVNALFALSSNRRTLWTGTDTTGSGAQKIAWNNFLLNHTLPTLYGELLEKLSSWTTSNNTINKTPLDIYNYFPTMSNLKTPFDFVAKGLAQDIVKSQRKVLYNSVSQKWCAIADCLFETDATRVFCGPNIRTLLDHIDFNLVDIPSHIKSFFELSGVTLKIADPELIAKRIKSNHPKLTYDEAEEFLEFILAEVHPKSTFKLLFDIWCIPLVGFHTGLLEKCNDAGWAPHSYYYAKEEFHELLPGFPNFVDTQSRSYNKLLELAVGPFPRIVNIFALTLSVINDNMKLVIPASWKGAACVAFPPGKELFGNAMDKKNLQQGISNNNNAVDASNPNAEKQDEWKSVQKQPAKKKFSTKGKNAGKFVYNSTSGQVSNTIPSQESENAPQPQEMDPEAISSRLTLLWKFIEDLGPATAYNDVKILSTWPIIQIEQGYVFLLEYARKRLVLPIAEFNENQRTILQKFGVVFASDATPALPRLCEVVGTSKKDLGRALNISYDFAETVSRDQLEYLRDQILEWMASQEIIIEPSMLRTLPIYRNFNNRYVSVASSESAFAAPSVGNSNQSAPHTPWDVLLSKYYPDKILNLQDEKDRKLLAAAEVTRWHEQKLVTHFLIHRLKDLQEDLMIAMLKVIAKMKPWKDKQHGKSILENLRTNPIIVLADGQRKLCSDFLDPMDSNIREILGENTPDGCYPPPSFCDPEIAKVLQHCGILTLRTAEGFKRAAVHVAKTQNVAAAKLLIQFFATFHLESSFMEWKSHEYTALCDIPFIPALDLTGEAFPPPNLINPPSYPAYDRNNYGTTKAAKKKALREIRTDNIDNTSSTKKLIENSYYDDEDEWTVTFIKVDQIFQEASIMIRDAKFASLPALQKPVYRWVSFNHKDSCLPAAAWLVWTECLVFPKSLDTLPLPVLQKLRVHHPPSFTALANHITNLTRIFNQAYREPLTKSNENSNIQKVHQLLSADTMGMIQASISLALCQIHVYMNSTRLETSLSNKLSNVPFVLMPDGTWVYCNKIVYELEEDISEDARAPPEYLRHYQRVLSAIGSPSVKLQARSVAVVTQAPDLYTLIQNSFNDPLFSDITFVLGGNRKIYAHKLVLGLTCDLFKTMFSSGMKESIGFASNATNQGNSNNNLQISSNSGLTEIILPEWAEYEAAYLLVKFLYTGEVQDDKVHLYPPTQQSTATVCCLLRLADQYFVEHVKEWCEVYLSHPDVMQLQNICSLLSLADDCNAKQLLYLCMTNIKSMFHVVKDMQEWKELPTRLKNSVAQMQI